MIDDIDDQDEFEEEFAFENNEESTTEPETEAEESDQMAFDDAADDMLASPPPIPASESNAKTWIIAIVILAAAGWFISNYFFGAETPEPLQKEAKQTVPVEPDLLPPEASNQPKTAPWLNPEQQEAQKQDIITAVMEKIEGQKNDSSEKMTAMEKALENMTETIKGIGANVGEMSQEMSSLSRTVRSVSEELQQIQKPIATKSRTELPKKPPVELQQSAAFTNPIYRIHAIIPGRVWLKSKEGKTVTVTEGDMLEEYGKVLVIDAPSGIVVTSSGITLR